MFQFHQNNSQLLFHVIVSPWGAGAFSRALKIEKLKAPLFPGPGGAGDANDWCINGFEHLLHLSAPHFSTCTSILLSSELLS